MKVVGIVATLMFPETHPMTFLIFFVDGKKFALPVASIDRVISAVELTTVPETPDSISGVINVHGLVIPVVNIRKRFHLKERDLSVNDRFIISNTLSHTVALWVDAVGEVVESTSESVVGADSITFGFDFIEGVTKVHGDIVPIPDITRLILQTDVALSSRTK